MTFVIDKDQNPIQSRYKKYYRKVCNTKILKRRLPIIGWLPKYNVGTLVQDSIAGLTVGLTAIPQGIAYAVIAGVPPEYGLYSSLTAGIIYAIFGSCKDLSVGPTAILSAITTKYVSSYSADFAVLASFLSGVLILVMAVFRLGFLVEFMSLPVTSGFTTAAALQISMSQIVSLLGLKGGSGNYFAESVYNIVHNVKTINIWDAVLGLITLVMLILFKKLGAGCNRSDKWVKKSRWLISIARNTIVIVIGMFLSYFMHKFYDMKPFTLIGTITPGLPEFGLPPFKTIVNNETYSFTDMAEILGAKFIVIPFVSILEVMILSKIFCEGQVDVTQEMLVLGLMNIVGSCGKSIPITGAFSRTALNHVSNVQTPLGGILTCILITLSLTILTSSFAYIPKTALAALIISAMITMINLSTIKKLWRNSKKELVVLIITIVVSLGYGLEFGIIAGILTDAIIVIYRQARPDIDVNLVTCAGKSLIVIQLTQSTLYCAAEYLRRELLKLSSSNDTSIVIINGTNLLYLDYTVASNLMSFSKDLQKKSYTVVFLNFDKSIKKLCIDISPDSLDHFIECKNYANVPDLIKRNT